MKFVIFSLYNFCGYGFKMVLLDFELNFWELYAENNVIYLKIFINKNNNKSFYLNDEAIQKYMSYGKDYISQLSSKICKSLFRNEYNKYFTYLEVSKEIDRKFNLKNI